VIEKFDFHLVHCFKYPFIENQVKCGKYYLRVWVEQNLLDFQTEEYFNSVRIPYQEEEQFQFNLKAALQECIKDPEGGLLGQEQRKAENPDPVLHDRTANLPRTEELLSGRNQGGPHEHHL